jgi:hypothetical protein
MGPEVHLLLDTQCSQLGPAYCMTGAAESLEWATLLDNSILSMALKRPTFLLRRLPNTSAGSYVLLLKMELMVLNGPSILFVSRCRFLGMGLIVR